MASERFQFIVTLRDRFTKGLRSLGRSVGTIVGQLGRFLGLSAAISAALGALSGIKLFTGAIRSSAEFEEQLARVGAVSRATATELALIEAETDRLGATTRFTATEAAQGAEELARAGQSISEVLSTLPPALNLAQANNLALADSAQLVATTLNQYRLEASQSVRVTDALTAATQRSAQDIEQLRNALEFAGPEAKASNLTLEETVAIIGKLADVGFRGEKGGTALRNALIELRDPASNFRRELAKLGIDGDNFLQVLAGLDAAGSRSEAALVALGKRAGPAISALVAGGVKDLGQLIEALNESGGTAARTAAQMDQTLTGATKGLASAFDALRRNLAKPLLQPITETVGALTAKIREVAGSPAFDRLRDRILELFNRGSQAVIQFLADFDFEAAIDKVADFVARTGTKLKEWGASVKTVANVAGGAFDALLVVIKSVRVGVEIIVSALAKAVQLVGISIQALIKFADLNPIGDLSKEIEALGKANELAGSVSSRAWDNAGVTIGKLRDRFAGLIDRFSTDAPKIEKAGDAAEDLGDSAEAAADGVETLAGAAEDAEGSIEGVGEAAAAAADSIGELADEERRAADPELLAQYDALVVRLAGLATEGGEASEKAVGLRGALERVTGEIRTNIEATRALGAAYQTLNLTSAAQFENLKREAVAAFDAIVAAQRRGEATQADVNNAFARLAEIYEQSTDGLEANAKRQVDAQLRVIAAAAGVRDAFDEAGDTGEDAGDKTADSLSRAADAAERLRNEVEGTGDEVEQVEKTTETAVAGISAEIGGAIASFHALGENVSNEVNRLLERITTRGEAVGTFLQKLAGGLREIQAELEENQRRADEALERSRAGLDRFGRGIRAVISDFVLLDQVRLDNLRAELDRTDKAREAFTTGLTDGIAEARRQLAELEGTAVDRETDRTKARLEELRELLRESVGDPEIAALIREEIALQERIALARKSVADDEAQIRTDRAENVRLAREESSTPRRAEVTLVVRNELDPTADRIALTDAQIEALGSRLLAQVRQSGLSSG